MNEKHKAIFKGVVSQYVWRAHDNISNLEKLKDELNTVRHYKDYYSKDESVKVEEKINNFKRKTTTLKTKEFLNSKQFWSGEIFRPELEIGEKIYINDLDLIVKVTDKYRATNGEIIYETMHDIRAVETDRTNTTRLEAVDKWFKLSYQNLENFEQLKSEFEKVEIEPEPLPEWKSSWEKKEKKEKSWFGWLKK